MSIPVIALAETGKLLASRRGLLSIVGFLLLWALVLRYAILPAGRLLELPDSGGLVALLLDRFGLQAIAEWPAPQLAVYWIVALKLLPLFAVVTAADQMASDRSRGTLRYLIMRVTRNTLFFGRFIGHALIQFGIVILTVASVLAFIAWSTPDRLAASVAEVPALSFNLWLVLLPYVALMAWVSVLARSPRQATLLAIIIWIAVSFLVAWVQSRFGPLLWLDWILPGSQVSALMRLSGGINIELALIPVIHTIVLLAVGALTLSRQDL